MSINVTELDFDAIKSNLIDHLKTQTEFQDYDFTGSAMNVLIDTLAYTTHYMAIHANMSINEVFLDSAVLRNSVISKAKELGYFPRQRTGSLAIVNLSITPAINPGSSIVIDKGTKFVCALDGQTFEFVTTEGQLLVEGPVGTYSGDINIIQGIYADQVWVHNAADDDEHFIISQKDIDTDNLSVNIALIPGSPTVDAWSVMADVVTVGPESKIFFLQEVSDERVEIYFGDGVLGEALIDGNEITATYLTNKGSDSNGCAGFVLLNDVGIYLKGEFTLTDIEKASGGAEAESIESIKHIAPLLYQAQNRAVSVDDYKALLLANYGDIETVSVWGGESNVPPQYGRVFISIKPVSGLALSPGAKDFITINILDRYSVVGILPELVDPIFTYLNITSEVVYDGNKTTLGTGDITLAAIDAITGYFDVNLSEFDTVFRYSRFLNAIDDADVSILNNVTTIDMVKKFDVVSGERTYLLEYNNEIEQGSVTSDEFDVAGDTLTFGDEDGILYEYVDDVQGVAIGVVDYALGSVTIQNYDFDQSITNFKVQVVPAEQDIYTKQNNLLILGETNVISIIEVL